MKKMLAALMACMLLLSAIPATADNVRTSGDYQYTIKGNGTATIVGYTGKQNDIILPSLIDGYTITTIGANAFACERKANTRISVSLPSNITSIEDMAFDNRNVYSINIPDSLAHIGYGAFSGCAREIQFRIANNHPYFATINGSLYNKRTKELLKWCYVDTFYGAEAIPEGITSIGSYSFENMDGSTGETGQAILDFPLSITQIGEGAFKNAERFILTFNTNSNILTIPDWAFGGDIKDNFYAVRIDALPYGVKHIGNYAFQDALYIPSARVDAPTFDEFLSQVEDIGQYAFSYFRYSTNEQMIITIPESCKLIGEGAFYRIDNDVYGISLAVGVERIESKAFIINSPKYETVYLPDSLIYIANDAFNADTKFIVEKGSYAERWAEENAYNYTINGEEQNLDWLNN